jgi:hypothetical protein
VTVKGLPAPSGDGPFGTREQAEIRFAAFCRAALAGVSGAPGAELVFQVGELEYDTLADIDVLGIELGDYDRQVLGRIARMLDPIDCAVLNSLFLRAAHDQPDATVYVATPPSA